MPDQASIDRAAERRDAMVAYIGEYIRANGYAPSHAELVRELGVSRRMISKDLARLMRDGRIIRTPGIARSLRLPSG